MRMLIVAVVIAVVAFFGFRMYQNRNAQQAVQEAAQQATQQAEAAAKQAADAAKQAAGTAQKAAGTAVQAAGDAAQQVAGLVVGGVDVGAEVKGMIEKATASLGTITDQASAQAALPTLDELKGKVDGVAAQVDQLPADGKKLLASLVSVALPPLKELAAKASSIQGAEAIKPTVDGILAKLEAWAKAPA
jgi:type II secretory pathway pseudopilin PulG